MPSKDNREACIAGLGYALLPCRATILERRAGALSEVLGFAGAMMGHVWICEPEDERLSEDVRIFLKFLHDSDTRLSHILARG
jgi:DNA-binding transcriptional LysR family regulator